MALKLNKANAMLSKLRHVLNIKTLEVSLLCYIWVPFMIYFICLGTKHSVKRVCLLQKKSCRILFFQSRNSHTGPLFKVSKILKSFDKTALENCIFLADL